MVTLPSNRVTMTKKNMQCLHCGCNVSIVEQSTKNEIWNEPLTQSNIENYYLVANSIVCPNDECKKLSLEVIIEKLEITSSVIPGFINKGEFQLLPDSIAKPFPEYVPEAIRKDYQDACRILNITPNASAALSRRCLQGMIRNFFQITEKNLYLEINALKDKVALPVWEAIDTARKLGNIGAHMVDVSLIADVTEGEAELLVALNEMLIRKWYIAEHNDDEILRKTNSIITSIEERRKQ